MARTSRGNDPPIRITTAPSSAGADIASRQRRYLIAMGVRTLCFLVVAFLAITHAGPGWLAWIFVAGALVLPYVAVVMANASETKSDGFELLDGPSQERELPKGTHSE
jgi:O-antigen/teichoic acid export membrane protein